MSETKPTQSNDVNNTHKKATHMTVISRDYVTPTLQTPQVQYTPL